MKKLTPNRFDNDNILSIYHKEMDKHVTAGDKVIIKYDTNTRRPKLTVQFFSYDDNFSDMNETIDISDYMPETPYTVVVNDATMEEVERRGPNSWVDFMDILHADLKSISGTKGLNFDMIKGEI